MKKVSDILPVFINQLQEVYEVPEIKSIAYLTIYHYFNFNRSDTIIYRDNLLSKDQLQLINETISRLRSGEPIQYILGTTTFYRLKMIIKKGALIPRNETEELVDWVIKDNNKSIKSYLDIGTGSGCIIIALAKHLEGTFDALDISREALKIARDNCTLQKVNVHPIEFDIMNDNLSSKWDVIVSNPPYVTSSDQKHMHKNVLEREPEIALFADENNPLLYYNRIADQARTSLNKNGLLYFEINEKYGNLVVDMLDKKGFVNIELKKDINDKDRMVKAKKK